MYFSNYNLTNSCLIDMLEDILNNETHFNKDFNCSIDTLKLKNIYLILQLNEKKRDNEDFIKGIFDYLDNKANMTAPVDVIGDRFYYLFEGYKKISSLKHYNMVDSAWASAYDLFYSSKQHNNVTIELKEYEDFKKKIRELINLNDPYIEMG